MARKERISIILFVIFKNNNYIALCLTKTTTIMKFYPDALKNKFVPYSQMCENELTEIKEWLRTNKRLQGSKEFNEKIERAEDLHEIVFDL